MNDYAKTLAKMKKAGKLVRLAQRKNGPKSYKRGQGALQIVSEVIRLIGANRF